MICRMIDKDEDIPYGELVRCDLKDMLSNEDWWVIAEWNKEKREVYKSSLLFQMAETPEETNWILGAYNKLLNHDKIIILSIDCNLNGFEGAGNLWEYYGGWLTEGENFELCDDLADLRNNLYAVFCEMLQEDGVPFLEVRITHRDNSYYYDVLSHHEGKSFLVKTVEPPEDVSKQSCFFNEFVNELAS